MRWLCIALALALPALAAQAPTSPASAGATAMWTALEATRWGTDYATWQRAHPQSTCREFRGPEQGVDIRPSSGDLWSHRCQEPLDAGEADWVFYALDPTTPVPRLEQVRMSFGGLPPDQLEAAHRELANRLSSRYGAGQLLGARDIVEWGSSYWRQLVRWRTAQIEIYLFLDEFPPRPRRLGLTVRHRDLIDVLAADRALWRRTAARWTFSGTPLDSELARGLGGEFSAAGALLTLPADAPRSQAALRQALTALLDAARSSTSERRALLLMAADRLAARVGETERVVPGWDQERARLGSYGLTFEWAPLGSTWLYTHDLLWRVWEEHGDTAWGEQAFLQLLSNGWATGVGCRPNPGDAFRNVIANGEGFLRDRPRSAYRPQILLFVAQGYETWWSLSRASERETFADPQNYQEGAATARQKAIASYDELLRLPGTTIEAAHARLALPRLKLGIDTGQRRFLCVYD